MRFFHRRRHEVDPQIQSEQASPQGRPTWEALARAIEEAESGLKSGNVSRVPVLLDLIDQAFVAFMEPDGRMKRSLRLISPPSLRHRPEHLPEQVVSQWRSAQEEFLTARARWIEPAQLISRDELLALRAERLKELPLGALIPALTERLQGMSDLLSGRGRTRQMALALTRCFVSLRNVYRTMRDDPSLLETRGRVLAVQGAVLELRVHFEDEVTRGIQLIEDLTRPSGSGNDTGHDGKALLERVEAQAKELSQGTLREALTQLSEVFSDLKESFVAPLGTLLFAEDPALSDVQRALSMLNYLLSEYEDVSSELIKLGVHIDRALGTCTFSEVVNDAELIHTTTGFLAASAQVRLISNSVYLLAVRYAAYLDTDFRSLRMETSVTNPRWDSVVAIEESTPVMFERLNEAGYLSSAIHHVANRLVDTALQRVLFREIFPSKRKHLL